MVKSRLSLLLLLLLLFIQMNPPKPVFICGGCFCPEAWSRFIELSPTYIILTANVDNIYENLPGNFKIYEVKTKEEAQDETLYKTIINATGIFITGGDQYTYHTIWKNTLLAKGLQEQIGRIPILTSSASSMILGGKYYTAEYGTYYGGDLALITIGQRFFFIPLLLNYIIDTHYTERNRQQRLSDFCQVTGCKGIGIDEYGCLMITGDRMEEITDGKVHFVQ